MICVFEVTTGPSRGCRFWVRQNEKLVIGRRSSADFSVISDSFMSRDHCLIEGVDSFFRVRDVGSANGTYVNNAKVNSIELCDGDRIRLGNTTMEVRMLKDGNPHAIDGIHFGQSIQRTHDLSNDNSTILSTEQEPVPKTDKRRSTVEI